MSRVGDYYMEMMNKDREWAASSKSTLKDRCVDILLGNGFDSAQADSMASIIIKTHGHNAINECKNLTP